MVSVSQYWQLVSLSASGKTRVQEIVLAKEFFIEQFPDLSEQLEVTNSLVQKRLLEFISKDAKLANKDLAEFCLRCYISRQIELACLQLEQRFGREHDFNRYDLFSLVLDDTPDNFSIPATKNQGNYKPLAVKILETFDPQKATLSTWVTRLVKQCRELNLFLLEKGIYLISDWAILNDTNNKQLKRILREFHSLIDAEISQASILLENYHAVYRQDRLQQRKIGVNSKSKCQPPTQEQLIKIASAIAQKSCYELTPEIILSQLQDLANLLRQYRIYVRGGKSPKQLSLEAIPGSADRIKAQEKENESQEQIEFLEAYRQQFINCLDISVETVVKYQYNYLAKKKKNQERHYLKALKLFHCQGKSMGEIAPLIDLKAQYQVTRLLKLKELRTDIRQKLLQELRDRVLTLATKYTSFSNLKILEDRLKTALTEKIDTVINEAEVEAKISQNRACNSLFASRLCHYLKLREAS